jgi:hypothetical protein
MARIEREIGRDHPAVAHEESDVNVRAILTAVVALIVLAGAIHVLLWMLFEHFAAERASADPPPVPLAAPAGQAPPEPRLQTRPRSDLDAFRAMERAWLAGEPAAGEPADVNRISIDRAKQLILERGLPARPGATPPPPWPAADLRDASSGRLPAAGDAARPAGAKHP